MKQANLTLKNFAGREFTLRTYTAESGKRPVMIVVPGGSFDHLSKKESYNKFKNICLIMFIMCYKVCYNLTTRW